MKAPLFFAKMSKVTGTFEFKVVVTAFLVLGWGVAGGLRAEDGKEIIKTKEVIGRLSSRSPINTPNYIGITLIDSRGNDTNRDMFFSVDKDLKVSYKKKFSDIKIGDTVRVIYDEIMQVTEDGQEKLIKRTAKIIKFVRSKEKK